MNIRQATENDAPALAEIYNWYIRHTTITFESDAVDAEEMKRRVREKLANYDWLVAEIDSEIIGYAYYGSFRQRTAYRHTVESTIYLSSAMTGKGYGKILYSHLIQSAGKRGFREMLGVIALPNAASVALHEKLGFSQAGILKEIGYKLNRYINVGIWQKSIV